jgi:hypothetical protein
MGQRSWGWRVLGYLWKEGSKVWLGSAEVIGALDPKGVQAVVRVGTGQTRPVPTGPVLLA